MSKEFEVGYKLIPTSEITDEARKLAVIWAESNGYDWIGDKQKLASDIMNYAIKYHKSKLGDRPKYEIRIGSHYNYFDTPESEPIKCKIIDIFYDGNYIVYEFRHHNSPSAGSTIHPQKLKPTEQ